MMKNAAYLFTSLSALFLSCCQPPPVNFFVANPYVSPLQETFTEPLTIILGKDIEDEFVVSGTGVHQFRKSLRTTLYYMFEGSFADIQFAEQVSPVGYTLQLHRIRPSWEVLSDEKKVMDTEDVIVSPSLLRQGAHIRYEGAIHRQNKKVIVLDAVVRSEQYTYDRKGRPEVFRDGVRELCEVLYKDLLKTKVHSARISGE